MFGRKQKQIDDLRMQLMLLQYEHETLTMSIQKLTELLTKVVKAGIENRGDFELLAQEVMRVALQQHRLVAHIAGKTAEDYITRDFTGTIH